MGRSAAHPDTAGHGDAVASALTGGYHLAFAVGAGLVICAIALTVDLLGPELGVATEPEREADPATEAAYSEAA